MRFDKVIAKIVRVQFFASQYSCMFWGTNKLQANSFVYISRFLWLVSSVDWNNNDCVFGIYLMC